MQRVYVGRVWKFGSGVTTDDILPGQYLDRSNDEVGSFAMAGIDPEFTRKLQGGDIIVAGQNFGAGSGRETAVLAIKQAGIPVVVAESFARVFFRNAINNGLIPVVAPTTASLKPGSELRVDIGERVIEDLTTGERLPILNLAGISLSILQAGGIVPFTQQRLAERSQQSQNCGQFHSSS